jgi:hypothetical protein
MRFYVNRVPSRSNNKDVNTLFVFGNKPSLYNSHVFRLNAASWSMKLDFIVLFAVRAAIHSNGASDRCVFPLGNLKRHDPLP